MIRLDLYRVRMRELIAASETFRRDAGTDAGGLLANHIREDWAWFEKSIDDGSFIKRLPLVMLQEQSLMINRDADSGSSGGISGIASGRFQLTFFRMAKWPGDRINDVHYAESKRDFLEFVGLVVGEMAYIAGSDSNLGYDQIEMESADRREPEQPDAKQDVWRADVTWDFGTRP